MKLFDRLTHKNKPAVAPADGERAASRQGAEATAAKPMNHTQAARVLLRPVVSEKAVFLETGGTYTFAVKPGANKTLVKQAVKEAYGVMPVSVRVINVEGKDVRFGRSSGKRSDWKKAIVTLPKGKMISIHEGV